MAEAEEEVLALPAPSDGVAEKSDMQTIIVGGAAVKLDNLGFASPWVNQPPHKILLSRPCRCQHWRNVVTNYHLAWNDRSRTTGGIFEAWTNQTSIWVFVEQCVNILENFEDHRQAQSVAHGCPQSKSRHCRSGGSWELPCAVRLEVALSVIHIKMDVKYFDKVFVFSQCLKLKLKYKIKWPSVTCVCT